MEGKFGDGKLRHVEAWLDIATGLGCVDIGGVRYDRKIDNPNSR